jgi:hypothetical protein
VRIDDGRGQIESSSSSKRLDAQLTAAEEDLRKRVDQGLDRVQQVLDKSSHAEHQPQNPGGRVARSGGGGDRLGAALIGLESGSSHIHGSMRDGHSESRAPQREAAPSSSGRGGGGMEGGSRQSSAGVTANGGGGRWLLNPQGIGAGIQAAMQNLEGMAASAGGRGRASTSARSPSPLSDSNDGGASMEERKERRRLVGQRVCFCVHPLFSRLHASVTAAYASSSGVVLNEEGLGRRMS